VRCALAAQAVRRAATISANDMEEGGRGGGAVKISPPLPSMPHALVAATLGTAQAAGAHHTAAQMHKSTSAQVHRILIIMHCYYEYV
jgi:hypothetical protein